MVRASIMFHSLVAFLAMASVAVHAMVGCHFCGGNERCCEQTPSCCQRDDGCCTSKPESSFLAVSDGQPQDDGTPSEEGPRCSFVVNLPTTVVKLALSPAAGIAFVADVAVPLTATPGLRSVRNELSGHWLMPPRHLRAVTQVWLL